MSASRFAAIILSAGFSRRMKRFKPLLPLGDTTIVGHVIDTFKECGIDIILVAGYRHQELTAAVDSSNVSLQLNPDYEKGMFTSVMKGIEGLQPEHRAFFILPVDIPLVSPSTVNHLVHLNGNYPDEVLHPVFRQRRGHPPLVPASYAQGIREWNGPDGLKGFLGTCPSREVPVDDPDIVFDVDTPENYEELLRRYARQHDVTQR